MSVPTEESVQKISNYIEKYAKKVGLIPNPNAELLDAVLSGLAKHLDDFGRPLCPCRFYPDKQQAVDAGEWLCPCDDMKKHKFCHCMLFVTEDGLPVTENLPEDHDGKSVYGVIEDPSTP